MGEGTGRLLHLRAVDACLFQLWRSDSHLLLVVFLMPQQVSLGENLHARGAVLRDESPAGAFLDGYHRSALDDVIQ